MFHRQDKKEVKIYLQWYKKLKSVISGYFSWHNINTKFRECQSTSERNYTTVLCYPRVSPLNSSGNLSSKHLFYMTHSSSLIPLPRLNTYTGLWRHMCCVIIMPTAAVWLPIIMSYSSRCSRCMRRRAATGVPGPAELKYPYSTVASGATALPFYCTSGRVLQSNILCLQKILEVFFPLHIRQVNKRKLRENYHVRFVLSDMENYFKKGRKLLTCC